jgi:hypothetical protein
MPLLEYAIPRTKASRKLAGTLLYSPPTLLLLTVLLASLHGYYLLDINITSFTAQTRGLDIARNPHWSELIETTRSTASVFVLIGTGGGVIGLWLVKVCILRFLGLLFDAPLDLRQSAAIITRGYIPIAVFSALALGILWAEPPAGNVGWLPHSDVAAGFSDALVEYFTSVERARSMRVINAFRIAAEMASAVIIFSLLDRPRVMSWMKALIAALILAVAVNLLSIVRLVSGIL